MPSTVLFVDDEPSITAAQKRSLRKEPYDIVVAGSGREGLELMSRMEIDVVVSDEQMPGMSGSEFLTLVRRDYPETMTMILTGQAKLAATIRAINDAEIFRFLLKPCSSEEMSQAIRKALQHRHLIVQSRRLLAAAKQQSVILQALESENPGITRILTDHAGAIVMPEPYDEHDVNRLIRQLNDQSTLAEELTTHGRS